MACFICYDLTRIIVLITQNSFWIMCWCAHLQVARESKVLYYFAITCLLRQVLIISQSKKQTKNTYIYQYFQIYYLFWVYIFYFIFWYISNYFHETDPGSVPRDQWHRMGSKIPETSLHFAPNSKQLDQKVYLSILSNVFFPNRFPNSNTYVPCRRNWQTSFNFLVW